MPPLRYMLPICLGLALCAGQRAAAQERQAADPLDALSVTAERDDPRRFANASVVTVPHEELTRYGDTSLLEAVRRIPGITFDGTEIRFRGLGSGYTQILINGDPAPLGFTLDSLSPDTVERIEIYKTPVADLGTQSIAGSINIVLKTQSRDRHLSAKAGVAYSQGNKSPSVSIEGSDTFRQFSFQLTGTASKDMRSQASHIVEFISEAGAPVVTQHLISEAFDSKEITYNLTPLLSWKSRLDAISWQVLAQRLQYPFLYDLNEHTITGVASDYPYSRWQSRSPTKDLYKSNFTWSHEFSGGSSLESKLNASYQGRRSNFYFDGVDPNGLLALDRNIVSSAIDRTLVSKEKFLRQLNAEHALTAGWDGSVTQRSESRLQIDRVPPLDDIIDQLDQLYDARVVHKAVFAEDEWTVSRALDVYLGVRLELTDVKVSGPGFNVVRNESSIVSPIAQLVWKLPYNQKDQVRIGIAHTSRAPTTAELVPRRFAVNTDNGPANPDNQGNPYLRPERAWGLDVSYESYLQDGGLLSLGGYLRHLDDVMVQTLFTDGTEWVSSTANSGDAVFYGTEMEFKLPLQRIFRRGPRLEIKGDLSLNWSHVRSVPAPDNRLADQTPLSADLGLEYESTGALSAGADIRFTAGYADRATRFLSAYTGATQSLDVYGVWQVTPTSRVRLSFENTVHRNEVDGNYYADPTTSSSRVAAGDPGLKARLAFEIGI